MGRNLARIGSATASTVALATGLLGLVQSWPRWLLIGLGVAGLIGIALQFFWERRGGSEQPPGPVTQSQAGGPGSRNLQAGRDITNIRIGQEGQAKDR
jgi:hypothetical protein